MKPIHKLRRKSMVRAALEELEARRLLAFSTQILAEPVGTPNEPPKVQIMPPVVVEKDVASRTPSVLSMAYDAQQDPLSVLSFTQPAHGTLTGNSDGSFDYTPAANYTGVDSFTYTVTDGRGGNVVRTLNLSVVARGATLGAAAFENVAALSAGGAEINLGATATTNISTSPRLIDWDNDGDQDLIVAANGKVQLFRNSGTPVAPVFDAGVFVKAAGVDISLGTSGTWDLAWADATGDGKRDLLISRSTDRKIRVYANTGTGAGDPTFAAASILKNTSNADFVAADWRFDAGDWNGDGKVDIVTGGFSTNIILYTNVGTAAAPRFDAGSTTLDTTGKTISGSYNLTPRFADVNQDGLLDLLVSYNWGNIDYYLNIGTSTAPALQTASRVFKSTTGTLKITDAAGASPDFHALTNGPKYAFGDVNGDGTLDLVIGSDGAAPGKVFYATGRTSTQILADINAYLTAHPTDLFVYLNANAPEQARMNTLLQQLYAQAVSFASPWERADVATSMLATINAYPNYLRKQAWDMAANPGIQSFAAQWWIILLESNFDSIAHRTAIADAAGLMGDYRKLMIELGVIWGDNSIAADNAEAIYQWLITTPHEIWPTPIITGGSGTGEWFGPRTYLTRARTTKNVFAIHVGGPAGSSFASDGQNLLGQRAISPDFLEVLTHEIAHDTDAYVNWLGGDYRRRWGQILVHAAGSDAAGNNYVKHDPGTGWYSESLTKTYWQAQGWWDGAAAWYNDDGTGTFDAFYRSASGIGKPWRDYGFMRNSIDWFLYASQESLATQANQHFVTTEGRILVALDRWKRGYTSNLTEVVHFIDVWSAGLNKVKFYDTHPINSGDNTLQQIEIASLRRNANGHIDRITVGGRLYEFTVNTDGRITAIVNVSPVANADTLLLDAGSWKTPNVLANDTDFDGDAISLLSFTQPAFGSVVDNGDGTFTFTPNASFTGRDSFTYTISDGRGGTATGTVGIIRGSAAIMQTWKDIGSGIYVTDLTGNARYPNSPDEVTLLESFEAPVNRLNSYGVRIEALLSVPTSGTYNLWIASDDYGELWLSTGATPTGITKIAYVNGWTDSRQWTKYSSQKSANITLTAGQKYYIRALMKEGTGGDNLAVAIQGPGITQQVIPAAYLSPYTGNLAPTVATAASSSLITGSLAQLNVMGADDKGESELIYTWTCIAKPAAAADPVFSVNGTNAAKSATATLPALGSYTFRVTISDPANLSVTSQSVIVTNDQTPPTVISSEFDSSQSPHRVRVRFSENVHTSLAATDLVIEPPGDAAPFPAASVSYDAGTNTATFLLSGTVGSGAYVARLAAGAAKDASGNANAAEHALNFSFLVADANRDGKIDIDDYFIIDVGYARQLLGYGNGDFNYSGAITADDYFVIDQAFMAQGVGQSASRPLDLASDNDVLS